jgi:RHS repeat-associated protein
LPGAHAEYDIDEVNRIRGQVAYFANNRMGAFGYSYDEKNRRRSEQRDWRTADGWSYDQADEVTSYTRDGTLQNDGSVASDWMSNNNSGIAYDNNGNRTQVSGMNGNSYAVNNLNQYTWEGNSGGLGYNGNGNLTSYNGWSYSYDAQNRLIEIDNGPGGTYIEFKYDGMNRVIASDISNEVTSYVWDNWNLIEELHGGWPIKRCYLNGAQQNEMVAAFDGNVYGTHWYWQDGRGNTSHITGDNNYLLERYTYDLEGRVTYNSPQGWQSLSSNYDTRFLFAGSLYIPQVNLYDMRNRYYSPELNRFLQTDPAGFKGDALNLYRYCGNDDVDKTDPMGWWEVTALLRAIDTASTIPYFASLNADSSFAQVAVQGTSGKADASVYQAINRFTHSLCLDGKNVSPQEIGRAAVRDSQKAASLEARDSTYDPRNPVHRLQNERAIYEYPKGRHLVSSKPVIGGRDSEMRPSMVSEIKPPLVVSHSHGVESRRTLDAQDVPNAIRGRYIVSVASVSDPSVVHLFVPAPDGHGSYFSWSAGAFHQE